MQSDDPGTGTEPAPQNVADPGEAKQTRDPAGRPYVVQRLVDDGTRRWDDIATGKVQPRTQRTTIVLQAIREANIQPDLTDRFRVLDEDAAEELAVSKKEPAEPEYLVRAVPID